jgi:3-isopropylmalate/(R)-2-methylmalate dehydratase small subunit
MIGASLEYRSAIEAFAAAHWARQPWVKDVARRTKDRLDARSAT